MNRLILLSVVLFLCLSACVFGMGKAPVTGMNMEAPDFSIPDLKGSQKSLSDYRGKVVFLNFWATNCTPCKEEMPSMQRLYEKFGGKDFVMLAVSLDRYKEDAVSFVQENKYTFPVLLDLERKAAKSYQVTGIPTTFIIDKNGIIAYKVIGKEDWSSDEAIRLIDKMIK